MAIYLGKCKDGDLVQFRSPANCRLDSRFPADRFPKELGFSQEERPFRASPHSPSNHRNQRLYRQIHNKQVPRSFQPGPSRLAPISQLGLEWCHVVRAGC